jgi:hypothetical protein
MLFDVKLYRGSSLKNLSYPPEKIYDAGGSAPVCNKAIVFDMDETLGHFNDLIELLKALKTVNSMYSTNITGIFPVEEQSFFNTVMDLFPEFLRKGIIHILEFVLQKKQGASMNHHCYKIYMYTNNIYSPEFPQKISHYIDHRLNVSGFFDKLICAFKINGVVIEPLRTTHKKTYNDFINCTMLPKHTEICYIDDTYYDTMKNKKIFYIHPYFYHHGMTKEAIIHRFINSHLFHKYTISLEDNIVNEIHSVILGFFANIKNYNKSSAEYKNDTTVSQKISYHVKEFFYMTTRKIKTRKNKKIYSRFTKKKK